MKIINNYLSKSVLLPTISIIIILSFIILITQSLKYVDLMVSHGVSSLDFLYMTTLLIPSLLFITIPICLFVAVIYSLNKLMSQRELNILKSVGASQLLISKPILKIALIITIFHYFLSLYLMPIINRQFKDLTKDLKENYISFFLQEKVFNHPTDSLTFYIKNKINDTNFEDIFYQDKSKKNLETLIAKKAELVKKDNNLFINFINGNRQELNDKGELIVLYFDSLLIQLDLNKDNNSIRKISLQEFNLIDLLFPKENIDPHFRLQMLTEASQRITWPFYNFNLTMLAIAALLFGEFNRIGKTKRIICFSLIAGAMVILNNALINLGSKYEYAIILSYLFAFGIFGLLIYLLYYRKPYDI